MEGRLDPLYLKTVSIIQNVNTKHHLVNLGDLLKEPPQYGANEPAIDGKPEKDIRYIRITDIDAYGDLKDKDYKIAKNIDEKYLLKENDILFARSGATAGKTFIYKNEFGKAIFAGYLIRFKFDENKVSPQFVFYYTQLRRYAMWVKAIQRPSGQPNINSEEFKLFTIPLPPISIQNKIVEIMQSAYKQKQQKEQEAEKLLNSIDDFVLNELGIKLPKTKDKRYFAVNADDVQNSRFDTYYYQPKFKEVEKAIEKGKFEVKELKEIADKLLSGQRPKGGVRQISEGVPSLGGEHVLSDGSIATIDLKFIPKEFHKKQLKSRVLKKDIIIVKDGATTGKVGIIPEDYPFEEANINEHVFLLRVKENINPYFVFSILKSQLGQTQINREVTGGTIMGIIRETTEALKIPLPPLSIQNKIAEEVKRRIFEAEKLKKESHKIMEEAKKKVEEMIFG